MYEYLIENRETGERDIMFGYDVENAYSRRKLNPDEWFVLMAEYVD